MAEPGGLEVARQALERAVGKNPFDSYSTSPPHSHYLDYDTIDGLYAPASVARNVHFAG